MGCFFEIIIGYSICYIHSVFIKNGFSKMRTRMITGDPGGIRTPDPRLRRPLLCPTELLDHVDMLLTKALYHKRKRTSTTFPPVQK